MNDTASKIAGHSERIIALAETGANSNDASPKIVKTAKSLRFSTDAVMVRTAKTDKELEMVKKFLS